MTLKCTICGRFISYVDFDQGKARVEYIPDGYTSAEEYNYYHIACEED